MVDIQGPNRWIVGISGNYSWTENTQGGPEGGTNYYDYLSTQHSGLYVAFLKDNSGQRSNAVGINIFLLSQKTSFTLI